MRTTNNNKSNTQPFDDVVAFATGRAARGEIGDAAIDADGSATAQRQTHIGKTKTGTNQ
jgi:hypothetical protein